MSPLRSDILLDVDDLHMSFVSRKGRVRAVDGVSFTVGRGETLGLVGESGSGKSLTCLTILQLLPGPSARIEHGRVLFEGSDLLAKSSAEMRAIRGSRISMILQDSLTSLNPAFTIGDQIGETIALHEGLRGSTLRARVLETLRRVRIPDPEAHVADYPHALSGGMRQRVAGAIAIACHPALLIADEPTTALDVTVQAQYLDLLKGIQMASGMSMIFVTHDFGVVGRMCDRVAVMYAGRIVECATTQELFDDPRHPYTRALLQCLPEIEGKARALASIDGQPPDLSFSMEGCRFAPRCAFAVDRCRAYPPETPISSTHRVSCWRANEVLAHV